MFSNFARYMSKYLVVVFLQYPTIAWKFWRLIWKEEQTFKIRQYLMKTYHCAFPRKKKRFLCTFDFSIFWYELCLRDFAWQTKIRMKFIFECVRLYKLWLFRGTGWKMFFFFYLCLYEPFVYHKMFFTFIYGNIQ